MATARVSASPLTSKSFASTPGAGHRQWRVFDAGETVILCHRSVVHTGDGEGNNAFVCAAVAIRGNNVGIGIGPIVIQPVHIGERAVGFWVSVPWAGCAAPLTARESPSTSTSLREDSGGRHGQRGILIHTVAVVGGDGVVIHQCPSIATGAMAHRSATSQIE